MALDMFLETVHSALPAVAAVTRPDGVLVCCSRGACAVSGRAQVEALARPHTGLPVPASDRAEHALRSACRHHRSSRLPVEASLRPLHTLPAHAARQAGRVQAGRARWAALLQAI